MIPVEPGDKLPLFVTVDTGESDLYVTARVVNRATQEVIANTVDMVWDAELGGYVDNDECEFPSSGNVKFLDATYFVKNNAGDTLLKTGSEVFVSTEVLGGQGGGGGTVILGQPVAGIVQDQSVVIGIITDC